MSIVIHKNDSEKVIKEAIKKISKRRAKTLSLDQYFGKVSFQKDGLTYQKSYPEG